MPETVEVAFLSQKFNNYLINEFLQEIDVKMGRYTKNNIKNLEDIKKDLPLKCLKIENKSKVMFWEFENGWYMISKLGLMGWWYNVHEDRFLKKWKNIVFKFSNDKTAIYSDHLSFGTITITKDVKFIENEKNKLGVDIMSDDFTEEYLLEKVSKLNKVNMNKNIEDIIMDQKLLFSGIGNYLKAEILYASKISPYRKIKDVSNDEWRIFHNHTKRIITLMLKMIQKNQDDIYMEKAEDYINSMEIYMKDYDKNGFKVIRHKAKNGRTTHWVKEIQK